MSKYILGIDAGGTKTDACVADLSGKIIAIAGNGAAQWERVGLSKTQSALDLVITEALAKAGAVKSEVAKATFAMSGIDWPSDVEMMRPIITAIGFTTNVSIINDAFAALYAGVPDGDGIASIAGTGGKTVGQHNGKSFQTMGMRMGEAGGAGQVIGMALDRIAMEIHGQRPRSVLSIQIPALFGFTDVMEFFEAHTRGGLRFEEDRTPLIFELAHDGDQASSEIIKSVAKQHAEDVIGIAKQLEFDGDPFKVVRAGGLHTCGSTLFDDVFNNEIVNALPGAKTEVLKDLPVYGAINHALKYS